MKPVAHRVCGGIFTPDPDLPARYDAAGRLISPGVCRCGLPGRQGDARHPELPVPEPDAQELAAGEARDE